MTWVKIDDAMPTHPKISGLTDRAFRVHIGGLCYCGRYLTDGFVPSSALRSIGGTAKKAQELVDARLWAVVAGGYEINDYLVYNPSRVQVEAGRESRRSRAAAGGRAKAAKRVLEADHQARDTHPASSTPASTDNGAAPLPTVVGFNLNQEDFSPVESLIRITGADTPTEERMKRLIATRGLNEADIQRVRTKVATLPLAKRPGYAIGMIKKLELSA